MRTLFKTNARNEYPDDIFKESRMSFGDHIEELRFRMIRAIKYLLLFLVIGFALDGLGYLVHNDNIGIGKPMLRIISDPVETQVRDFYNRRNERIAKDKLQNLSQSTADPEELQALAQKLRDHDNNLSALSAAERTKLLGAPVDMQVILNVDDLAPAFGPPKPDSPKELPIKLKVFPGYITYLAQKGEGLIEGKQYLSSMSVQEVFIVYFKVSTLCGLVLGSPFILYQFWAFVGAGLYPHEKKYVYVFFGPSVVLFVGGVVLCQFLVLPSAVKALLVFNEWLGFDPDIRLKEWLSLAILLPLVFGISFQTPLVMIFMNRIGLFTAQDYLKKWKYAAFILVIFAATVTPTPDFITPLYLFIPMFGLYMGGVAFCHYFPPVTPEEVEAEAAEEVAV
jgi:sec-independent protein translocase protein TatC